jgi:hypothetical protein
MEKHPGLCRISLTSSVFPSESSAVAHPPPRPSQRPPGQSRRLPSPGDAVRTLPSRRAASLTELVDVRDAFVAIALLAQSAGAAGVEIHAAHGGPLADHRVSFRPRSSPPLEPVAADFLISLRPSQWKEHDNSARIRDGHCADIRSFRKADLAGLKWYREGLPAIRLTRRVIYVR